MGIERTKELYEAKGAETIEKFEKGEEEAEEPLPIYYIEKKLDITSVTGRIGNLPKTVAPQTEVVAKQPKLEQEVKKPTVVISKNPGKVIIEDKETKEEKKLRKKLCKDEKREKRKQKKELKNVFEKEKIKQQREIA